MKRKLVHLSCNLDLMPLGTMLGSTQLLYPVAVLAYRMMANNVLDKISYCGQDNKRPFAINILDP